MKKVLPTFFLTLAVLFGKSQSPSLWFNELVPDPGNSQDEFIEIYNTSTNEVALSCHIIISYFESNKEKGFYVYNFPTDAVIKGLSYYMISSNNPVRYKSNDKDLTYSPQDQTSFSNWNDHSKGAHVYKYVYNDGTWGAAEAVESDFANFMNVAYGLDANLLLYKINSNGTATYINGFFANPPSSDIGKMLTTMSNLNNLSINLNNSCSSNSSTAQINFTNINTYRFDVTALQEATGSGQGYMKTGDGFCGNWVKIQQGEFSPGSKSSVGSPSIDLITEEKLLCNNSLSFSIQSGGSSYFPVEVKLFYDKSNVGSLDASDEYISSRFVLSPGTSYSSFTIPDNKQPVLLVYQSSTGCFTKIASPVPANAIIHVSGNISCTLNVNNKTTATFSITSADGATFPILLRCFDDNGTPGNASDDKEIGYQTVIQAPFKVYSAELSKNNSNIIITAQSSVHTCVEARQIIANDCNITALPVKFKSFTANRNQLVKELVVLKWETSFEQNNKGFYIQRKIAGVWKNIAFVFSNSTQGNSSSIQNYEYNDMNSTDSTTLYQIQQIDLDGQTSYSPIKAVKGTDKNSRKVLIYPNPAVSGKINLLFKDQDGAKHVIVCDMFGRLVKQFPQVRNNSLIIDGLGKGLYNLKIIDQATLITTSENVIIER